ncbi:MAG: maltose alpha-D-glucosyltransferase [Anaerolineales bacterium]|nr:maltose alpha-D-glucosyltransferase [Anaerolineales bacterium]
MTPDPLWYKNAVFYQVYVRAFCDSNGDGHGDFPGLTSKLDYFKELGVDCLWIMPMYESPLKDDGYDIADYFKIHPTYGTVEDFKTFMDEAHKRGLRVITDLVLNHTSDQHAWFQEARKSKDNPYRDYYVWSDTDQLYKEVRIIFLDIEPSNWTFDETTGQYYWHRFFASQPDLNYDNPIVREKMKEVVRYWFDLGADGYRADAVPYLIEREGTSGENLPETHAYLKEVRAMLDAEYPDKILLCEANMWPEDVRPYFGDGDEFQMGFHFPIMPRIYMALKKGDATDMMAILNRTPDIPENCQWVTFLRNHDELTLEMVTEEDRQWMWNQYAPDPRMRLNLGIRRRLAPLLDNDPRKIKLANSLLFTLPGSPIIYYGDEIGMGDNIWLDDRNGVRTPMQWDNSPNAGFMPGKGDPDNPQDYGRPYAPIIDSEEYGPHRVNVAAARANPTSLYHTLRQMIALRKQHKVFGWGKFTWAKCDTTVVAAFWKEHEGVRLLSLNNLRDEPQTITITLPDGVNKPEILFGDAISWVPNGNQMTVELDAYQFVWFLATSS